MLSQDEIEQFVDLGYVKVEQAFSRELGQRCAGELWDVIDPDPRDRSSWTQPVVRVDGMSSPAFVEAARAPLLHQAFDELVGVGQWVPREGLGTFPLRFATAAEPDDAGWHVEGSFTGARGEYRVNLHSDGRALLMLFLFSEVGPDDAPTRIRQGSHLDVAPLLRDAGDEGLEWMPLCRDAVRASAERPVAYATGAVGDVYLCHPFLVHAAQPHRGQVPRFMAQPPLYPRGRLNLGKQPPSPVVRAIRRGLALGA
jgi:Phytanoyl-CoA dioxygenase (PhyH)